MANNVMEQTQETKKTLFSVEQNGFISYYDMGVMSLEELRQHFMESEHPFKGLGGKEVSESDFAWLEQSDGVSLSVTADIDNDMIRVYEINGIPEEERTGENTRIWKMELSEYVSEKQNAMGQAEEIINRLESAKTVFNNDERNLIVNYAYKLNDIEKTRELAERIYYNHGNQEAILAEREAQAEIDALPDPMIGISQMNEYGYTNKDMLPLTQEGALGLFEQNLSVYVLHEDGTQTMVEDREQIMEHAGIFGIEKDEWLQMLGVQQAEIDTLPDPVNSIQEGNVSEKQTVETNIGSIPIEDYRGYDYINTFEVYSQGEVKERIELEVIAGAIPTSDIEKIDQLQNEYSALYGKDACFVLKDENGEIYFENSGNEMSSERWSETVCNQIDLYDDKKGSPMRQAENIINRLESTRTVFNSDERNLIVNHAYKLNDIEKTRELAERIYYNHGNQEAILAKHEAQAEIDALPDPIIGISQMNEYGYTYKDMFPLTQERAMELFEQNLSVYVLHENGMETMVEDREQIMEHAGIFGIEKDEWLQMLGIEKNERMQNQNKFQEQPEKKNSLPVQSNKKEAVQQAGKKESVLSKLKLFQNKAKEQNAAKETPIRSKETSIDK